MEKSNEDDLVRQIEQNLQDNGFDPFTLLPLSTPHFPETCNQPMGTLSLPPPSHPSVISAPVPGQTIQMPPTCGSSSSRSNRKQTQIKRSSLKTVPEKGKRKYKMDQRRKKVMRIKTPATATQPVQTNSNHLTLQQRSDVLSLTEATDLLLSHYDTDLAPHVSAKNESGKKYKLALHRKLIPKFLQSITSNLDPNVLLSHEDLANLSLVIFPQIGFYSFEFSPSSSC